MTRKEGLPLAGFGRSTSSLLFSEVAAGALTNAGGLFSSIGSTAASALSCSA